MAPAGHTRRFREAPTSARIYIMDGRPRSLSEHGKPRPRRLVCFDCASLDWCDRHLPKGHKHHRRPRRPTVGSLGTGKIKGYGGKAPSLLFGALDHPGGEQGQAMKLTEASGEPRIYPTGLGNGGVIPRPEESSVKRVVCANHLDARADRLRGAGERNDSGVQIDRPVKRLIAKYALKNLGLQLDLGLSSPEYDFGRLSDPLWCWGSHAGGGESEADENIERKTQGKSLSRMVWRLAIFADPFSQYMRSFPRLAERPQ